jgi:hypothetical protein
MSAHSHDLWTLMGQLPSMEQNVAEECANTTGKLAWGGLVNNSLLQNAN